MYNELILQLYRANCTVCCEQCTVEHCNLCSVQLKSVHVYSACVAYKLFSVHCAVEIVLFTVYSVHCKLPCVQCTVYISVYCLV